MFLDVDNKSNKLLYWILLHLVIGALSAIINLVLIIWFYFAFFWFIYNIISSGKNKQVFIIYMMFYIGSFDVIARMARCSPFIPYELSKYLLIPLLLYALIISKNSWNRGHLMFILVLPAFFYDISSLTVYTDIINYGLGPIILSLSVAFFIFKKLSIDTVFTCLRLLLYTSLMVLAFAYIRTPDYNQIEFTLAANFQTSGDFGSNQVANVLGLGVISMLLHFFYNKKITGYRYLDFSILCLFILQALLTMSRGGVLTVIIALFIFIIYLPKVLVDKSIIKVNKMRVLTYILIFSILAFVSFSYIDSLSGSLLSLRYQGETLSTQTGAKEKTLSTFTSNRYTLFETELAIWADHPILGVGVGASKYLQPTYSSIEASSHTEFSRLLADHGLLGLIYLICWISIYFFIIKRNKGVDRALLITFFVTAFFTSTHSAMRVFITPLLTGLSVCLLSTQSNLRLQKPNERKA